MTLSDYLNQPGRSVAAFAREVGCSRTTAYEWKNGGPCDTRFQRRVVEVTNGVVSPADLVGVPQPKKRRRAA